MQHLLRHQQKVNYEMLLKKLDNDRSISAVISRASRMTAPNDWMMQALNLQSYKAFSILLC